LNESGRRDWVVLVVLWVLGILIGRTQTSARDHGSVDFVSGSIQGAVAPISSGVDRLLASAGDLWTGMLTSRELIEKNRRLEQQVRALSMYDQSIARMQRELTDLRATIDLPSVGETSRIYARVLAYFPREGRMSISAGSAKGVQVGSSVATGDGLVGVVSTVSSGQAQVALLGSAGLRIGAMTQREPPAAGLLRGDSSGALVVEFANLSAPLDVGDLLVTTGYGKLPRGLPIGRVVHQVVDQEYGRRLATIEPAVQSELVREVVVLQ
jgi:rod shape-determining protein MreC